MKPEPNIVNSSKVMEELPLMFQQGKIAGQQILEDGGLFPILLLPPSPGCQEHQDPSIGPFLNAIQQNREWIDNQLKRVGALLFRGFPVRSASDFNAVVEAFGWEEQRYIGFAYRTKIEGRVYTASEAPLHLPIKFHHEMNLFPEFPNKVMFFCEIAPPEGGQTAIVLSHKITKRMEERYPQLVRKMEKEGLIYPFSFSQEDDPESFLKGWQSHFQTKDKQEAERKYKAQLLSGSFQKVRWADDGRMLFEVGPIASIRAFDGDTEKKAWFNLIAAKPGTPPMFGDGSPLPAEAIESCIQIIEEECVEINWEAGDVLVLDNLFVQHARRPSTAPRRVLAALCK